MIFFMVIGILACYIGVYLWLSHQKASNKAVLFMIAPTVEVFAVHDGLKKFYQIIKKHYPKASWYVVLPDGCSPEQRKIAEKAQKLYHYEIYKNKPNNKIFQKIYLFVNLRQGF
ncbi:MAG: hypothetical protein PHN47_07330 [Clostridia bacterium]|jgi:hypothetical protein|nr:hypothetical protein [Clostridia bacterium]MDD4572272.1 hypothetical protein [Clostridia bacterium]